MRHRQSAFVGRILSILWLSHAMLPQGAAAHGSDVVLFNFDSKSAAKDWTPVKLPEVPKEQPAPAVSFDLATED